MTQIAWKELVSTGLECSANIRYSWACCTSKKQSLNHPPIDDVIAEKPLKRPVVPLRVCSGSSRSFVPAIPPVPMCPDLSTGQGQFGFNLVFLWENCGTTAIWSNANCSIHLHGSSIWITIWDTSCTVLVEHKYLHWVLLHHVLQQSRRRFVGLPVAYYSQNTLSYQSEYNTYLYIYIQHVQYIYIYTWHQSDIRNTWVQQVLHVLCSQCTKKCHLMQCSRTR